MSRPQNDEGNHRKGDRRTASAPIKLLMARRRLMAGELFRFEAPQCSALRVAYIMERAELTRDRSR
jgi:hypothetical protein